MESEKLTIASVYNALIPLMQEIRDEGYAVECHCSTEEGYGFYIQSDEETYVHIRATYDGDGYLYAASKWVRMGRCRHDVVNDEMLDHRILRTVREVENFMKEAKEWLRAAEEKREFAMRIRLTNAAFYEDNKFNPSEVARILREVADMVEKGSNNGSVNDINGNQVGQWEVI